MIFDSPSEHLDWAKQRALEYLDGQPAQAHASFVSDLGKDERTEHLVSQVSKPGLQLCMAGDAAGLRRLIEKVTL